MKLSDQEQVNAYMSNLKPEVKSEIEAVRKIIKNASPKLNERIKWNATSYYYLQARYFPPGFKSMSQ